MGKSKDGPSFFRSAGARLITCVPKRYGKAEAERAERTRSALSLTAASGKPTITMRGVSVSVEFTSTSTSIDSTPKRLALYNRVIIQ